MVPVDYSKLKSELLKQLLHEKQTSLISRQLGYSFDQVRRWQAGTKELRWDEFCDLCEVLKVPLQESLRRSFLFDSQDPDELYFFMSHLRLRNSRYSLRALQEKIGVHPSVLKRYFSGQVFPSLELVFSVMNLQENLLGSFLLGLVGPQSISSLNEVFNAEQAQVVTETHWPLASAIEGLLNVEEYLQQPRHHEQWFLDKLGVSLELFQKTWKHLRDAGLVIEDGEKFKITYNTINTNGASVFQVCKMVDFWTERARLRFLAKDHKPVNHGAKPNIVAYRIVPMSLETMKMSTEILMQAYQNILSIAQEAQGPYEDVRVLLLHHFSVSDFPKDPLVSLQENLNDKNEPHGSDSSVPM